MLPVDPDSQATPPSAARPLSLRRSLVALVGLCVLPASAAALVLVYLHYQQGWERVRQDTVLEARHRAAVLDRELASVIAGMKALATAPELAGDDLAAWQQRASAAAPTQNVDNYLLTDREGRQRVNTLRPYGTPLPTTGTPLQLASVFDDGRTVVTDVFIGPVTQQPVMAIGVPVVQGGTVRYSLNIGISPRRFQTLLDAEDLPEGWVAAVLDSQGTIVARTREPERYVGQSAVPEVVALIASGREGSIETMTVDGVAVVSSFSRSTVSDWSVAVGAPRSVLERQLVWWMTTAAAGVFVVALTGLWMARAIARRVTAAVQGLNLAAQALVEGAPFTLPVLQLQEAHAVGQALLQAAVILQRTRHAAQHDPLTGLSNRTLFGELLHHQMASSSRRRSRFAVLMLDLDGLKRINDGQGHAAGDSALRATARRILHTLRAADAAARLSGDEFAVLLEGADEAQARATALRLLDALAEPDEEYPEPIGASIGIALWPDAGRDSAALMNAADAALYAAKREGKGRVMVAPSVPA